jgi:lipoprotein-anchoring transpeptidase ErfK/SrfK
MNSKILALILIGITLIAFLFIAIFVLVIPSQKRAVTSEVSNIEAIFKEGKYQEVIMLSEAFVKKRSRSKSIPDVYYYLAMSKQKLDDIDGAMKIWENIIKKYPKSKNVPEAYYYIGYEQEISQNFDKALENYTIITNKYPDTPIVAGATLGMGRLYEMKGQDSEAISAYQNVIERFPDSEFVVEAEQRLGNIALANFIKENSKSYTVERGESLVTIAKKFNTTPQLITKINNLSGASINVGQTIKVIDGSNLNIFIDLSKNKLYLKSNDKVIKSYYVCSGKKETPTPTGDYKVTEKMVDPTWFSGIETGNKGKIPGGDPRNELGTRWIGFKPTFGIHGTIFPESIGKSESHGCVRMQNAEVEELYDMVVTGTPIKIEN